MFIGILPDENNMVLLPRWLNQCLRRHLSPAVKPSRPWIDLELIWYNWYLSTCIVSQKTTPVPSNPFNVFNLSFVDLTEFVRLQFSHQTEQAAKGTCTTTTKSLAPEASAILSECQRILRYFSEIIKKHDGKGVGTGLERAACWKNAAAWENNEADSVSSAGNSANTTAAAKTAWTKVCEALLHFQTSSHPTALGAQALTSVIQELWCPYWARRCSNKFCINLTSCHIWIHSVI